MSFSNAEFPSNFPDIKALERRIDLRLGLSLKRDFFVSKLNSLLPQNRERHLHAYCVGTPRSGTHSIAHMLQQHYPVAHEPHAYYTIYHVLKRMAQEYTYGDIQAILQWYDRKHAFDVEAAHYLHHVVDVLVASFPNAKFILTVRDPLSWLESEINRNYSTRRKLFWRDLENYRYGRYQNRFTAHETALEQMGLYPIASYLSYWRDHNQFVLNTVPKPQCLVISTREIHNTPSKLAHFLDIDINTINLKKSHANKRNKRFKLTELVDKRYLNQQLDKICTDFIEAELPHLHTDASY